MFWDFLAQNWLGLLIVLVVLGYLIYLTVTKQWIRIREFAYELMLMAERSFKDEEGKLKYDFVVEMVYRSIPSWLKLFIKKEDIQKLIEKWYQTAKDYLDDGVVNDSIRQVRMAAKK